jgi:hypothetical protein
MRWVALLFAGGSLCFAVGPFPGFVQLVGPVADAAVFFAGSLMFTAAALLQFLTASGPWRRDQWAGLIQLAGTVFFNISTFNALQEGLSTSATDRLVWSPDVFGSICFLVSSALAYAGARAARRRTTAWWIAALNLAGSVAFGISAVASYVVPETGDVLDLAAANFTTALGALCFLAGAVLLLVSTGPRPAPSGTAAA